MKVIKTIIGIFLIGIILISCQTLHEVTEIYPVKEYAIVGGGVEAVFEIKGLECHYFFEESTIYPCEESSRVIIMRYLEIEEALENANAIYLYLNEAEHKEYIKEIYDIE